jgi:GMP reductase
MVGGMFAGTDECDGEVISKYFQSNELEPPMITHYGRDGIQNTYPNLSANKSEWKPKVIEKKFKLFYGMSSEYAQDKHGTGLKEYRASEGRVDEVECKGPVDVVVKDLLGGLRSTGTYIGAESIKQFGKCATLVRVSRVHDRF